MLNIASSFPLAPESARVRGTTIKASKKPLFDRFVSKIAGSDGCWIWLGPSNSSGYGEFWLGDRMEKAHRVAYMWATGPLAEGLQIDHLCRNRLCVNPKHLEQVTSRVNSLRGEGIAAMCVRKTHCVNGHPLSGENLINRPHGHRGCKACARIARKSFVERNREAVREANRLRACEYRARLKAEGK